ncbi:MAG: tetratricopeptide repeat protein, partial [Nitrospina sp.]|nr:tetratricopeptide repeat protein [Nitrospina sp.]
MNNEPMMFEIKIDDFDFDILPIGIDKNLLEENPELRAKAVVLFYEHHLEDLGGDTNAETDGEFVKVYWTPKSKKDVDEAVELAVDLLTKGAYGHAEPLLNTLNKIYPDRPDILFNYGMMLSDQGKLDKSIDLLSKLTNIQPENANGWNALGIAHIRNEETDDALKCLKQSHSLDPENGHTLRNLGGLMAKEKPSEGLPYLGKAAQLLPENQEAQFGYALCLL